VGKIAGRWLESGQKVEIALSIEAAKDKGISMIRICRMWAINRRRVSRWRSKLARGQSLANAKPGPKSPVHKLLPAEKAAVLQMARAQQYVDLSHRMLTVTGWDLKLFFVSFSSVYRILRSKGLMCMRGKHRHHNGRSLAPVRKQLTGANQRWCWDISYLKTYEKGLFVYLYLLLDEYSRKAINWVVSWNQTAAQARQLLEGALLSENILDLPEDQRPEIINDRGRQMKAKPIKRMFDTLQMPQLFARPRTPNDNPFVESAFSTIKTAPSYPGRFLDCAHATKYFERFFAWYNSEHYHSGIDYVTPDQCHRGLRDKIVSQRRANLAKQRNLRKEVNRSISFLTNYSANIYNDQTNLMTCSVIPP
jgi:transposase InsO family protein